MSQKINIVEPENEKVSGNTGKQADFVKSQQDEYKAWVENQVLGLLNTIPGPYKFTYEDSGGA